MIDKKISVSEQVANLPVEAQLVYTWSIPHADDLGILPTSTRTLKAIVCPLLDITQAQFDEIVAKVKAAGLYADLTHEGKTYLQIKNFLSFQILKKDRAPQTMLAGIGSWKKAEEMGFISNDKREEYSGEAHHNWKGGVTDENTKVRNSREYASWRLSVFERDLFTCQDCGKKGVELEAHHIKAFADFPDDRLNIENGVTLCKRCHKQLETTGNHWKPKSALREGKVREDNLDNTDTTRSIAYLGAIPTPDMQEYVTRFQATEKQIKSKAEDLRLYCEGKGKSYRNYKSFLLNALKRDFKEREDVKPGKYGKL